MVLYPLRTNAQVFFSAVCEQAKLHQRSLIDATRGCDGESEARADLARTIALARKHKTLQTALAESVVLSVVLWDAEQYCWSLLDDRVLVRNAERTNCLEFIERCRKFRHTHIGKNWLEKSLEGARPVNVRELLAAHAASGKN